MQEWRYDTEIAHDHYTLRVLIKRDSLMPDRTTMLLMLSRSIPIVDAVTFTYRITDVETGDVETRHGQGTLSPGEEPLSLLEMFPQCTYEAFKPLNIEFVAKGLTATEHFWIDVVREDLELV